VGGDKTSNLIYRFEEGLLVHLQRQTELRQIFIHIGTNNLNKKALKATDLKEYSFILTEIKRTLPQTAIYITGLFDRKTRDVNIMNACNQSLKKLAADHKVSYIEPPTVELDKHYDDHIHLNFEGYTIWEKTLADYIILSN
jgi:lysophospholipase L1-like esterase